MHSIMDYVKSQSSGFPPYVGLSERLNPLPPSIWNELPQPHHTQGCRVPYLTPFVLLFQSSLQGLAAPAPREMHPLFVSLGPPLD